MAMLLVFNLAFLMYNFDSTEGSLGIDVSSLVSTSSFKCLVSKDHYNFVIVRAFRSSGTTDSNALETIRNAQEAGIQAIDAYMFPCPKCGDAKKQVEEMLALGLNVNRIWLDIEIFNWFSDKNKSRAFFENLISALEDHFQIGVYTSLRNWFTIMGDEYTQGSRFPLWYAHYDKKPNFDDFKPFGGWMYPTIKQFAENVNDCGVGIDINWKP